MPWHDIAAIITASGKGIRFGQPKADALLDGTSFLEKVSRTILEAGITRIIAAVYNDTDDMLATLRRARQELAALDLMGILVYPVDFPYVTSTTVAKLCAEAHKHPEMIIRPVHSGKPGHPIILPGDFDLFADDQCDGLRGLIKASLWQTHDIPVHDPGILRNINTIRDMDTSNEH